MSPQHTSTPKGTAAPAAAQRQSSKPTARGVASNQSLQHYLRSEAMRAQQSIGQAGDAADNGIGRFTGALSGKARLTIGRPDDPLEHEADRIAEQVISSRSARFSFASAVPQLRRKCAACAGEEKCPACAEDEERKQAAGGATLRRKSDHASGAAQAPSRVHAVLRSPGRHLDSEAQRFFGSRFGRDLSTVRVHDDAQAAASARDVQAKAYTVGDQIVFGAGAYEPDAEQGRKLIAHELAHVLQQATPQMVQRQPEDVPQGLATPHDATLHAWPTVGESVRFGNLELTQDRNQLENLVWHLIAVGDREMMIEPGIEAGVNLAQRVRFSSNVHAPSAGTCPEPDDPNYESCHRGEILRVISEPLEDLADAAFQECKQMLDRFYKAARKNALDLLAANEQEAKAEAIKYGIKIEETTYEAIDYFSGFSSEITITSFAMDEKSPGAAGLRKAAHFLLERRKPVYAKIAEQNEHAYIDPMSGFGSTDAQYDVIGKEVEAEKAEYNKSRAVVTAMFPVLSQFSDIEESEDDLRQIAETAPGPDIARLVGKKINDTLKNIKDSREGLDDDVNVWRLDPIIGLTKAQFGADTNPVLTSIVDEKVRREQPGILTSIALGVMNIAAILLAPETGGLSLAAAAGVNVAVTASHVKEYLQQKALAGSALDKARALSHDDPSLFWLAFEVVGTAVDVGTAAVTVFKTVAPLAKAAIAAKDAKEVNEALEAIKLASGDAKLADQVIAQIDAIRRGEGAVVKGFAEESKLFAEVGKLSEAEAAAEIGEVLETPVSKVHVSRAGHVFSCASPCTELGAKYANIFATDESLNTRLLAIQKDAGEAATLRDAGKLAEADALAGQVKHATADLEAAIRQAHPEIAAAEAAVEAEKAAAATQIAIEGAGHAAPAVLPASRMAAAAQKLAADFPALAKLEPGAMERIVRAGFAVSETGGLRQAVRWASRVRGQLLEELAAVRVRGLLTTAEGRAVLGLEKEAGELTFIEGSRIRDAQGLQLTDGMVVRRTGARIEIVAVVESKAGAWSAGKLSESLQGLKRMSAGDLVEGVVDGGLAKKIAKIDPGLAGQLSGKAVDALDNAARTAFRERLLAAIDKLPDADLKPLKKVMQAGEGQVSSDIERLMEADDRTVQIMLKDAQGGATSVTAELPKRPRFLGTVPSDVGTADLAKTLRVQGFDFANLDLAELGMTQKELDAVSRAIIKELGSEFETAANVAK
jgi:hypothetical protein